MCGNCITYLVVFSLHALNKICFTVKIFLLLILIKVDKEKGNKQSPNVDQKDILCEYY